MRLVPHSCAALGWIVWGACVSAACGRSDAPQAAPVVSAAAQPSAQPPPVVKPAQDAPLSVPVAILAGEQRVHHLYLESDAHVGDQVLTQFTLRADVVISALGAEHGRSRLHVALRDPVVTTTLPVGNEEFASHQAQLRVPFGVQFDEQGKLVELLFGDEPSGLVNGIRQLLASSTQEAVLSNRDSWVSLGVDGTGTYEVRYAKDAAAGAFRRQRLRYLTPSRDDSQGVLSARVARSVPTVEESDGEAAFFEDGVLRRLKWTERVSLSGKNLLPVQAVTKLTLEDASRSALSAGDLQSKREQLRTARAERLGIQTTEAHDRRLDEAKLAGRTFSELIAALRALPPVGESATQDSAAQDSQSAADHDPAEAAVEDRRAELHAALQAYLRLHTDGVPAVLRLVQAKDPLGPVLLGALGAAGTPEALSALMKVLRAQAVDRSWLRVAAIALSRTPRPSADTVATLEFLLEQDDLRTQAVYGLGTSVRQLRELGQPDVAQKALGVVLARLAAAKDVLTLVTCLRAVANSGDAGAFEQVKPHFSSEFEQVRAASMDAIRLMPGEAVDAVLAQVLTTDPTKKVRMAAARSLNLRKPTPVSQQAAVKAVREDVSEHVRWAALTVLVKWLPERPELAEVLRAVVASEKQETIRAGAERALASIKKPAL